MGLQGAFSQDVLHINRFVALGNVQTAFMILVKCFIWHLSCFLWIVSLLPPFVYASFIWFCGDERFWSPCWPGGPWWTRRVPCCSIGFSTPICWGHGHFIGNFYYSLCFPWLLTIGDISSSFSFHCGPQSILFNYVMRFEDDVLPHQVQLQLHYACSLLPEGVLGTVFTFEELILDSLDPVPSANVFWPHAPFYPKFQQALWFIMIILCSSTWFATSSL